MTKRSAFLGWPSLLALAIGVLLGGSAGGALAEETLDPMTLTKYMDPLPVPGIATPAGPSYYEIGAWQIQQQLHSQLPPTTVYGYGTSAATASYPGPTIVVQKDVPTSIRWTNHLPMTHLLDYAIDPTIPKAVTTTGVPITTHVHGAEVEPQSDGGPMTWFTAGFAETGHDWQKEILSYANTQLPATIWYHDHAFGYTRLNVYAGLAGYYLITDPGNEPAGLPAAPYDLGICIQDRMFTEDGELWYPDEGVTEEHPIWVPEFFGDVIVVNGKVWPYLEVEPRKYRFRFLDGAQSRFFSLALAERVTSARGPAFYQIASDGGYLAEPILLNDPNDMSSPRLLMAPGERCEVIIDFSAYAPGTEFLLKNTAKAPFPRGESPNPQTAGQIMLFRVVPLTAPDNSVIPPVLTTVNRLGNPTVTRVMTLNEMMHHGEPTGALLNGMRFHDTPATEYPSLGSTEMWEIVNMTGDTHPIHIHLIQFQLVNRQKLNIRRYEQAFMEANPIIPTDSYVPVPAGPYLKGQPIPADANELGWKDTFRMNPGEVTRVMIRFAPQDESPEFAFDATAEPGYVWHCHILEHEENDMMRPYHLVSSGAKGSTMIAPSMDDQALPSAQTGRPTALASNLAVDGAKVRFTLPDPGHVEIDLYNVAGQLVSKVVSRRYEGGEHTVPWQRAGGEALGTGVYFLRLRAGAVDETMKLVVVH